MTEFTPHTYTEKRMQVLWLHFLTEVDEKTREIPYELFSEPEIKKARTVLEESAFSDDEMDIYDHFWDMVSVDRILHEGALRRGLAEGERLIAINLKNKGIDIKTIAQCTDLSMEEISKL